MLALVVAISTLKSSILYYKLTMLTGNLHRAGMAAFVIGLLMLFVQAYLFRFSNAIISFMPSDIMGYYANYVEFYFSFNAAAIILIIAGVVMFYRGRKEMPHQLRAGHKLL